MPAAHNVVAGRPSTQEQAGISRTLPTQSTYQKVLYVVHELAFGNPTTVTAGAQYVVWVIARPETTQSSRGVGAATAVWIHAAKRISSDPIVKCFCG